MNDIFTFVENNSYNLRSGMHSTARNLLVILGENLESCSSPYKRPRGSKCI